MILIENAKYGILSIIFTLALHLNDLKPCFQADILHHTKLNL